MNNPYKILGLKKDASDNEIKAAYRKLSKKYHPDHGGDKDKFNEICQAYKILINEQLRIEYAEATSIISNIFMGIISTRKNFDEIDIIDELNMSIRHGIKINHDKLKKKEFLIKKLEYVSKNFSGKGQGREILESLAQNTLKVNQLDLKNIERQIEVGKVALEMLNDAEFHAKIAEEMISIGFRTGATCTTAGSTGF